MGLDENIFADHKNSFPARKITRIACRSLEFGPWGTIDGHIRGDTAGRSIVAKIDRIIKVVHDGDALCKEQFVNALPGARREMLLYEHEVELRREEDRSPAIPELAEVVALAA